MRPHHQGILQTNVNLATWVLVESIFPGAVLIVSVFDEMNVHTGILLLK